MNEIRSCPECENDLTDCGDVWHCPSCDVRFTHAALMAQYEVLEVAAELAELWAAS